MNALPLASVPETEMVVSSGSTCWAVAVGSRAVCVADAAGGRGQRSGTPGAARAFVMLVLIRKVALHSYGAVTVILRAEGVPPAQVKTPTAHVHDARAARAPA